MEEGEGPGLSPCHIKPNESRANHITLFFFKLRFHLLSILSVLHSFVFPTEAVE